MVLEIILYIKIYVEIINLNNIKYTKYIFKYLIMSREGYIDPYPTAPPQNEVEPTQQVQYINSYPNNYIYHNKIEIERQIRIQKEQDYQVALQIRKMENELQQEKEKKSIWKKLCLCLSCLFCCCITCGV